MADLSTQYLGLKLKNPLIVGSSGLTNSVEGVKACEKAGAGAVVLKSIFEEQIVAETNKEMNASDLDLHPEAWNYVKQSIREHNVDNYLKLISGAKESVSIPVIASVNCASAGSWVELADRFEEAGADALELNIFIFDRNPKDSSETIEQQYTDIIRAVRKMVKIPIALKIGFFFTNIARVAKILSEEQIDSLVLFNRFMRADIDLNNMELVPARPYSSSGELAIPLRWIGLLADEIKPQLCGSTGVHTGEDALKLILAGADAVQVCSALYINKITHLETMLKQMNDWLDSKGYASVKQIKGMLSGKKGNLHEVYSRVQYMRTIMEH